MTAFLYVCTVLIWGSTWLAIYFQLGQVDIVISVFYRFALAALLLFPVLLLFKKIKLGSWQDQGFFVLQGLCLFSINFLCFYQATYYIPSGLISVIFSLATLYNAVNSRWFFKVGIQAFVVLASLLGVSGLVLLFAAQIQWDTQWQQTVIGIGLAALGTYCFSLGNMISTRHSKQGLSPLSTNAWAMSYGAMFLCGLIWVQGYDFAWDERPVYVWSLLYLAIFGTIIGFTTYLTLVARLGANRAAYATVVFPVISLTLSSFYENYVWTIESLLGLVLIMLGNIVIMKQWMPQFLCIKKEGAI